MRILAKCSYKGTAYKGWAKQNNDKTIQEEIEKVLSQILNEPINIFASGRTDAGVHALEQCFHFDINKKIDLKRMLYSVNLMLPSDIKILSFKRVSKEFHARYSIKKKEYLYRIILDNKDPINNELTYICPFYFDKEIFIKALNKFIGEHNFQNFTSKEEDEKCFVRNIFDIKVKAKGKRIDIYFVGSGFMRYMIRYIVGYSLYVAQHNLPVTTIDKLLNDNQRCIVSAKAPSEGLYLKKVYY